MGYFKLIRANGRSKRYSSMIKMLQGIDREDLETLWKLVKAKHENTRPEEDYERVLWGDLKVMFEPDIKSEVWRNLQGYKVTVWKLFDNCGVHFVRFRNLHIFMLVEKRYPLTPITISNMLNKKLQADRWNEIVAARIKDRKYSTIGSSKPPIKRRLVRAGSSSRATRQKVSPSKSDSPFLTISDDEEGLLDVLELQDANACHWKIFYITPLGWKGHLDNQLDAGLLDLYDQCCARQAIMDNAVN
ncbi:hypothetical protein Tco_0801838 [Tanacetum coccineum]|uniref:Uncharacterized protein n=1 Tax=Tanacetum coccineum TaxID=301880 RepID=A0ABQ5A142_9ASTR